MEDARPHAIGPASATDWYHTGQAGITAFPMRVTPQIADWAQGVEAEVLTLEPSLLPRHAD